MKENVSPNNEEFKYTKNSRLSKGPIKYILSNRAECDYIKEDDDFNLFDYIEDDFFSTEKAIELNKKENKRNQLEREKLFKNFMNAVPLMHRVNENLNINNKKKENGNLYEKIYSPNFDCDSLIIYLDKENNISILDTLIELMYQKYIHQSLFYLPQLCMFFNYKEYYSSLQSYLLDRCADQVKFSLQVTWLSNSFTEDDCPLIKTDIFENLLQKIEETLVNGQRNTIKTFEQYIQLQDEEKNDNNKNYNTISNFNNNDQNNIINNKNNNLNESTINNKDLLLYLEKQSRLAYFNICIDFYSKLKLMCEDLRNYPKEKGERKNKLTEYISKFNESFEQQRIENSDYLSNYPSFYGVILPFNDSDTTEDSDSNLIVRIIPEQCFCFSTKCRVPTKICAECITVNELKNTNFLNNKNKNLSQSFQFKRNYSCTINNSNKKDNIKKSYTVERNTTSELNESENLDIDKSKKLRDFLYNVNNEQNESGEIMGIEENRENIATKEILENNKDFFKDFEILPEITDELKNIFGKPTDIISIEIKETSPYKNFKSYKLKNFIAKANDDLRQELLAMQLIKFFDKIFKKAELPLKLHPYEILITSSSSGLLEFLENTSSIDGIKQKIIDSSKSLFLFYKKFFGENLRNAQKNFVESFAAYSLVCYYLQIKDRHNGNILIDMYGNIIHIDFGFMLGISPGNLNFESAPFKFTKEYMDIMEGNESDLFLLYKKLMVQGMIECKKYVDNFVTMAEILSNGSKMPCFDNKNKNDIFVKFRERFFADKKDEDFPKIVDDLIYQSYDNFWTNKYDTYQKLTNGIIP